MKKDAQAILYDQNTGKIEIIDKNKVCQLLYSFDLKETMTYEEIAKKCEFSNISNGIYNLKNKADTKLIFLIDRTLDEFKSFLKKNNLPVETDNKIILYHGSYSSILKPKYLGGKEDNDYGNGLYLTPHKELAKEWATSTYNTNKSKGYLFKIELDLNGLEILDFDSLDELHWLAELMYHRPANMNSVLYERYAEKFVEKYKINTDKYDIIKGWRADSSYFNVVRYFVQDELDKALIKKSFHLGNLGIQYFIKSQKAFDKLEKVYKPIEEVPYELYNGKYKNRDEGARKSLYDLVHSEENTLTDTFRKYIKSL